MPNLKMIAAKSGSALQHKQQVYSQPLSFSLHSTRFSITSCTITHLRNVRIYNCFYLKYPPFCAIYRSYTTTQILLGPQGSSNVTRTFSPNCTRRKQMYNNKTYSHVPHNLNSLFTISIHEPITEVP